MRRGERGRRAGRAPVWMAAALLAAGCGGGEKEGSRPLAHLNQGAAKAAELDSAPPPPPLVGASVDTARGADSLWGTAPSRPAPAGVDSAPAAPVVDTIPEPVPAGPAQWTARTVRKRSNGRGGTLVEVRTARNEGFDRVVLQFEGELPGYEVEYVDRPVRQCGSGNAVALAGDAWLSVRLTPARAHDDNGQVTVRERSLAPGLPVLKEAKLTCDFEADVTWVLGVARPNRFRVLELRDPARLVVDVRH